MHSQGVVHCDIKASNILLESGSFPANARIADFGLTSFLKSDGFLPPNHKLRITPISKPPEAVNGKRTRKPVDMWMCGMMLYRILTTHNPTFITLGSDIVLDTAVLSLANLDPDVFHLLTLLESDPSKRITAQEALSHKWINQ